MCSSVDYWRCRWIKLGGALEYPQRGPSDPHLEPDLSTVCPQGYPQGWRADPQGWRGGTRRCGGARASPRRRREHRRAGPTGRSASRSPCGRAGPAPPLRLRLTAALPRHRSPRAVPSARSPWARSPVRHTLAPGPRCPVEAVGVDPRRAGAAGTTPPPPPHPGAPIRAPVPTGVLGWWTSSECYCGPGSGRSWRASWLNAGAGRPRTRCARRSKGLPAQRGRGRAGGRRCTRGRRHTRPVRPVRLGAGAGGSVAERPGHSKRWPARIFHPPPRAPPVPKWRNDAIPHERRSRRAPERYAPSTFFRPADAPGRNGGAAGGLHRARTVIDTGPDRDGGGRQPVAPRESPHRPGSGPHQPDPSRPPSSVRPARTSAPTPGRGPARTRRRVEGGRAAGPVGARTRTGTATGPGPDSAPDPRHHGRTGEPPAADSGPARTRLAGPEARLGRGWFA